MSNLSRPSINNFSGMNYVFVFFSAGLCKRMNLNRKVTNKSLLLKTKHMFVKYLQIDSISTQ